MDRPCRAIQDLGIYPCYPFPASLLMNVTLPEALKADLPPTIWSKILSATPVVMAVVATLLAGLASSEMTRAQYDRSFAAELQSKAGDQWNFFQGKKLRGALQRTELDLMGTTADVHPLDRAALLAGSTDPAGAAFGSAAGEQALTALVEGKLPEPGPAAKTDASVQAALAALDTFRPDAEVDALVARIDKKTLEDALRDAQTRSLAFDASIKPIGEIIDRVDKQMASPNAGTVPRRDFVAARLGYYAQRYDTEARLNQSIASLYDLQVRKGNLSSERHHNRSQMFFYGMLVAQMGVIIATLAMAARKRNLLWSLAAGAGAVAIAFAIYVYMCV
jgi:hypothetical protein